MLRSYMKLASLSVMHSLHTGAFSLASFSCVAVRILRSRIRFFFQPIGSFARLLTSFTETYVQHVVQLFELLNYPFSLHKQFSASHLYAFNIVPRCINQPNAKKFVWVQNLHIYKNAPVTFKKCTIFK